MKIHLLKYNILPKKLNLLTMRQPTTKININRQIAMSILHVHIILKLST